MCPSQRAKFERMAQSLFPELHRACPSFLRHKDILMSPSMLRTYGVEYVQVGCSLTWHVASPWLMAQYRCIICKAC